MERPSNGGILYHEVQEANLCAVHCVNTVLQGPFFSEFDLAAVASDLDGKERQVMLEGAAAGTFSAGDFFSEESHNVSLGGDFSIQVQLPFLECTSLKIRTFIAKCYRSDQFDYKVSELRLVMGLRLTLCLYLLRTRRFDHDCLV